VQQERASQVKARHARQSAGNDSICLLGVRHELVDVLRLVGKLRGRVVVGGRSQLHERIELVGHAFYVFEQFKEMLDQTKSVQALAHAPRLGHVKFLTALQRKHMMRLFHVA